MSTSPETNNIKSARTPKRSAADPPTNAQRIGITVTTRGSDESAASRNPVVRIVVGHGTPKVGSRG
jgi:hypothetical protein